MEYHIHPRSYASIKVARVGPDRSCLIPDSRLGSPLLRHGQQIIRSVAWVQAWAQAEGRAGVGRRGSLAGVASGQRAGHASYKNRDDAGHWGEAWCRAWVVCEGLTDLLWRGIFSTRRGLREGVRWTKRTMYHLTTEPLPLFQVLGNMPARCDGLIFSEYCLQKCNYHRVYMRIYFCYFSSV